MRTSAWIIVAVMAGAFATARAGSPPERKIVLDEDLAIVRANAAQFYGAGKVPRLIDDLSVQSLSVGEDLRITKALTEALESNGDFEGNLLASFHTTPRRYYREVTGKGDPVGDDIKTMGGCRYFTLQAIKALDKMDLKFHSYMHVHMHRPYNPASSHQVVLICNDLTGSEFIWDGWLAKGGWVYAAKGSPSDARYPVEVYLKKFNKGGAYTHANSTLRNMQLSGNGWGRSDRARRQALGRDFYFDRIQAEEYGTP